MSALYVDGVDICSTYNCTISGQGIYDTPSKDYEFVTVPGRNGDILIDNERFKNLSVTYPCFITANFQTNFNGLKAFLMSRNGYVRIQDSYDPNHYRYGVFMSEVVPDMTALNRAGSFDLVFYCKPQRYLKNTEDLAVEIPTSNVGQFTINNTTMFTAKPVFLFKGSGSAKITINNEKTIAFSITGTMTTEARFDTETFVLTDSTGCVMMDYANFVGNGAWLKPGTNTIKTSGITAISVIDRFWEV